MWRTLLRTRVLVRAPSFRQLLSTGKEHYNIPLVRSKLKHVQPALKFTPTVQSTLASSDEIPKPQIPLLPLAFASVSVVHLVAAGGSVWLMPDYFSYTFKFVIDFSAVNLAFWSGVPFGFGIADYKSRNFATEKATSPGARLGVNAVLAFTGVAALTVSSFKPEYSLIFLISGYWAQMLWDFTGLYRNQVPNWWIRLRGPMSMAAIVVLSSTFLNMVIREKKAEQQSTEKQTADRTETTSMESS